MPEAEAGSLVIPTGGYCVYRHVVNGTVIYVGKGKADRAFDFNVRTKLWRTMVAGAQQVKVEIVGWHASSGEALEAESAEIERLKPPANVEGVTRLRRKRVDDLSSWNEAKEMIRSYRNVWG